MIHKAKKSLGQNFLKSKTALKKIIGSGEIKSNDIILEIGPGKGALTEQLLATNCQLIAVEKDKNLMQYLQEKFQKETAKGKLKLIENDILKFDPTSYGLEAKNYKLVANIPYNITGAILKKFLTGKNQPARMVLLVQQEVAQRIVARDKKESLLSISVKAYGEPEIIARVPARYFSPAPKVDSSIILIKNISRKIFTENKIDEEKFWEILRTGFAHKRKKLGGNLKNLKNQINKEFFEKIKDRRAEDLSLSNWINLLTK